MQKTPSNAVALAEPNPRERLAGLLAGMKDDFIMTFEHRGVKVFRDGQSMVVSDPETGEELGGRMILNSVDLNRAVEWIENKIELYKEDL